MWGGGVEAGDGRGRGWEDVEVGMGRGGRGREGFMEHELINMIY